MPLPFGLEKGFDFDKYAGGLGLDPGVAYWFSPQRELTDRDVFSAVGGSLLLRPNRYLMDDLHNVTVRLELTSANAVEPVAGMPNGIRFTGSIVGLSRGDVDEPLVLETPVPVTGLACTHMVELPGRVYHLWLQKMDDSSQGPTPTVRFFAHLNEIH